MSRLQSAVNRRRVARAHLREERALARAVAAAPTIESAHEISALMTRRPSYGEGETPCA
jgi:hypothetical protein